MDTRIDVRLLGTFQAFSDGHSLGGFESNQVRALLAYVVVEHARPHRRETLAELLWPEEPEDVALHRLRQALTNVRQVLGDRDVAVPALRVTRVDVQLNPARRVWSDIGQIDELLEASRRHPHRELALCRPCAERLRAAAELVGGPFLGGLSLAHSAPFADWAAARGERAHDDACAVLEHVAAWHERRGEYDLALTAARRELELESWREAAHRTVMRCLAASGDRAGAIRHNQICRRVLADELGVEPDAATWALSESIRSGTFPGVASVWRPIVRSPRARFVGRAAELAALLDLVARERIVTLSGPGGSGKTRLAARLADELAPDLGGRAWLVELDRVTDAERIVAAVATTLGVGERAGADPFDLVVARLSDGPGLLVLDNCEHLRAGCARLAARLAEACPGISIVATSREPLRLTGEVLWPVPPLGVPPVGAVGEVAAAADAVELFVDRVRRVRPDFALRSENVHDVVALCRRLNGLPLAIELAAAWARLVEPAALLRQLDEGLALAAPAREVEGVAPRHRSLRDVLNWSHDLLGQPERALVRRLAVFRGGWTIEMAEEICADPGATDGALPRTTVIDALAALFDGSLIHLVDEGGGLRYRFHETVRQYAAEKLVAAGEMPAARQRHARYFLDLAEMAAPRLRGPEQVTWSQRLARERPNLSAALATFVEQGDADAALRLVGALGWFWHVRGYWREGYELSRSALALPGPAARPARARALYAAGLQLSNLGRHDDAVDWLSESLAGFRAGDDRAGEAEALNALGLTAASRGDDAGARTYFEAALGISERLGDRWAIGRALLNLGDNARRFGDLAAARRHLIQAVADMRACGVPNGVGVACGELARVAQAEGALAEARDLYRECLASCRRGGVRYGLIAYLRGLAALDAEDGATAAAATLLVEARQIAGEIGHAELVDEIERDVAALASRAADESNATPAAVR